MGDMKWPALAIQAIFLAANIAFLLAGKIDTFIIASITSLMFLFTIQAISKNPRFMYLFPINTHAGKSTPTPSFDTWLLRALITLSILFFYISATGSYVLPCVIIAVGVGFPFVWDKFFEKYNTRRINKKIEQERKTTNRS